MPATTAPRAPVFPNFISGRWMPADRAAAAARHNPADVRDLIGYVPLTGAEGIQAAVSAASDAARAWRFTPAPARGKILRDAARLLEARSEAVAAAVTREQGKTLTEARGEVRLGLEVLEYMAGESRRLAGETLPSALPGRFVYTVRQPVGVVGLITPWNFPLAVPLWKIAPALVAGNTVVWKPSRLTPSVSDAIARMFSDVELPEGVLNVVHGAGGTVGRALAQHPEVRAISFTSSYEVGTEIYATAARQFKKVQCEAGGKSAVLVLSDADIERAAAAIVRGAFQYAGQRCTATSRVIVEEPVAKTLVDALAARAKALIVGDGSDPRTEMGPLSDELQLRRVVEFLEKGRGEGRLICGGERLTSEAHGRGWFVAPTIFDHVSPDAVIAQEEIFGPVLAVIHVSDFAAAVDAANRSHYGMTMAVFTSNIERVLEAVDHLECGVVHVNGATIGAEVHVPFGGIKHTGVGERELGSTAVEFYSERKVVYVGR